MGKSQTDRNRASKVRRRIKSGNADLAEIAWLDEYNATKQRGATPRVEPWHTPKPAQWPANKPANPPNETNAQPPAGPGPARTETPGVSGVNTMLASDAREQVESGFESFQWVSGAAAENSAPGTSGPSSIVVAGEGSSGVCEIPDCPYCKLKSGGIVCGETGKTVYPPMSKEAAQAAATGFMTLLSLGVSFLRVDKHVVKPSKAELSMMANGIAEMQARRVSFLGAGNDILMIVGAGGGFATRALHEKKEVPND